MTNIDIFDREILRLLLKGNPQTTHEVSKELDISWNTASKHLKKLERAGLIVSYYEYLKQYWRIRK